MTEQSEGVLVPEAAVHSAQAVDVSNFQPVCTFPGCDFAYCKATEGTTFIDHTFAANFSNAGRLSARGAYHFFHPSLSAIDQAHFFWAVVKAQSPEPGDFLVADIEIMVGASGGWAVPGQATARRMNQPGLVMSAPAPAHAGVLTSGARIFLDTLSSLAGPHHPVLVYTNLDVGAQLTSCTGYDLIIAWPALTPPGTVHPWKSWLMWQWGAGGGTCGGDSDAFNGDKQSLLAWQAKYQSGPSPRPSPYPFNEEDDMPAWLPSERSVPLAIPNGVTRIRLVGLSNEVIKVDWLTGTSPDDATGTLDVGYALGAEGFPVPAGAKAVRLVRGDLPAGVTDYPLVSVVYSA